MRPIEQNGCKNNRDICGVRDVRDLRDVRDVNILKKTKDFMLITPLNPTSLWCFSPDPKPMTNDKQCAILIKCILLIAQ